MILKPVIHVLGNTCCVKVSQWWPLKRLQQYTPSKINVPMSNLVKSFLEDYTGKNRVKILRGRNGRGHLFISLKRRNLYMDKGKHSNHKAEIFYSFYTNWQFMAEFTISKISGRIWWMIWWPSSLLSIISYYNAAITWENSSRRNFTSNASLITLTG